MKVIDEEIKLTLKSDFTPVVEVFQNLIKKHKLYNANLVCWVPHEVSSLVEVGWESGLLDDTRDFLKDVAPKGKWLHHDEPGTPFRYNFFEHVRTKILGQVHMTLIVKEGKLYIGKYQDLYFYSPVYKQIPHQKIFCRIMQFE